MPRKTILLIDDEEDFSTLLKLNIENTTEYEALVANGGEVGLELVKKHRPDLVLLDIMMPGMDGMETLERIKATAPDLPVAMVTAVYKEEEAKRCFDAGAYDYITKPVDFEHLKTALLVKLF
ncbi:MAG: response regulator transcription factor [Planctomycetota bacterium]|jgi:DNA-binding response OmpR family regulator